MRCRFHGLVSWSRAVTSKMLFILDGCCTNQVRSIGWKSHALHAITCVIVGEVRAQPPAASTGSLCKSLAFSEAWDIDAQPVVATKCSWQHFE